MRLTEDVDVAEALCEGSPEERVDILLGGHDHEVVRRFGGDEPTGHGEGVAYYRSSDVIDCTNLRVGKEATETGVLPEVKGAVRIIKSGSDWQGISCVKLHVHRTDEGTAILDSISAEQVLDMEKVSLKENTVAQNISRVAKYLETTTTRINQLGADPLAQTTMDLEGTGALIRSRECNLGSMLADMFRAFHGTDMAFVNSGSVRCNRVIRATMGSYALPGASPLTVRDLIDILPFDNQIMVKRIRGNVLLDALENSFSDAHTDGRFLHYSGLTVVADWSRPEGSRVLEVVFTPSDHQSSVYKSKAPLTQTRIRRGDELEFTVAMIAFIADGFDGYACFKDQETLVDEEESITDTELLLRTLGYTYEKNSNPAEEIQDAVGKDTTAAGYQRARNAIITGWDEAGLPIISPRLESRIMAKPRTSMQGWT